MKVPQHIWRHPTAQARDLTAKRFNLPNTSRMQDWEWEVADSNRIDEFLAVYRYEDLSDDEQFVIAEMLVQSFEESERVLNNDAGWSDFLRILESRLEIHIYTVWYWCCLENRDLADCWRVTPDMRSVLSRHRARFESS